VRLRSGWLPGRLGPLEDVGRGVEIRVGVVSAGGAVEHGAASVGGIGVPAVVAGLGRARGSHGDELSTSVCRFVREVTS